MGLGFGGEVADLYHRYRRGYPPQVIAALVDAFTLSTADLVVDLGCGTGQLALPIAQRARAVIGVDAEPDMVARARSTAAAQGVTNTCWVVGTDADMPSLHAVLGDRSVGAVTIGQALHWMDHETLFAALVPLFRPGGGVAVVTNGVPLWLQDSGWSRALREFLQDWLDTPLVHSCGTDDESQARYRAGLVDAGYGVTAARIDYSDELDLDQIVGGVYSALPVDLLPAPDQRPWFAELIGKALQPHEPFLEHVPVTMLIGRVPGR